MQPSTSQDAFSQLTAFQKSRRNPNDILQESQTRLGLPSAEQRKVGLRGAISNTENLLKGVDPSVTGRTAGTFTSEAQRNRLVQLERAPIADQFTEQSRALEGETANVADLNARALTEAQLAASAQDKQENDLRSIYDILLAREQQAEEKRRYEEEQRIAREAQAAALRASQQQSNYLSSLFKTNNPATTTATDPNARYKEWLKTQLQVKPVSSPVISSGTNGKVQGSGVKLQGGTTLQSGGVKLQGKGATTSKLLTNPTASLLRVM